MAITLAAVMLVSFAACAPAASSPSPSPSAAANNEDYNGKLVLDHEEQLKYAKSFTLTHYKGGYMEFTVASAKDKKYLVVPEGKKVPDGLAASTVVLKQPLNKITLNSTGMVSLVDAIGGLDNIATVGYDVGDWYIDNVITAMKAGKIKYSGHYKTPDFEMLTKLGVQLEVDTTMLDNNPTVMAKYDELKIPFFIESSSSEGHPLGRVEWIKLFGALMGLKDKADTYFNEQVAKVEKVAASAKTGKSVAMFYIASSNKVYPRNGGDYMAEMIEMAGGNYVMADVSPSKSGTTATTFEDVYSRCVNADYLFYINFALSFGSIDDMIKYNPLFKDFKAVKEGRVYATAPNFTQSTAAIGGIIEDMNTVLKDPTVATTKSLIKLK